MLFVWHLQCCGAVEVDGCIVRSAVNNFSALLFAARAAMKLTLLLFPLSSLVV